MADPSYGFQPGQSPSDRRAAFDLRRRLRDVEARLDAIEQANLDAATWINYSPYVFQGAFATLTATSARYLLRPPFAFVELVLNITGGATVAANQINVSLPAGAPPYANFLYLGTGAFFDSSSGLEYRFVAQRNAGAGEFRMMSTRTTATGGLGADDFVQAVAVNDVIRANFYYPIS